MKITGTVQEAARETGISKSKLYNLINEGRLSSVKVDRRTLIKWDSLLSLLEAA